MISFVLYKFVLSFRGKRDKDTENEEEKGQRKRWIDTEDEKQKEEIRTMLAESPER